MAVLASCVNEILNVFNGFHSRLQFTLELGGNKLNFLDITLIKVYNSFEFNWYHKPIFSGRYLNFPSQHPLFQKRKTILSIVDRVFLLSYPKFHPENLRFVIKVLLNNNYPLLKFIFNTINTRLKFLFSNQFHRKINGNSYKNKN